MPYIIGVHSSLMEEARRNEIGDAIVLNVDDGTIEDEYQDRLRLPSDCVSETSITLPYAFFELLLSKRLKTGF